MGLNHTTDELMRQRAELREIIDFDLETQPDRHLNSYYDQLAAGPYASAAVRTAIWDVISEQTVRVRNQSDGIHIVRPPAD